MPAIVTTEYVDDLDGISVDAKNVDTVEFSYRGNDYTLVLTASNGSQFDKTIAPYIKAAKKAQAQLARAAKATPAKRAPKSTGTDATTAAARTTASARKAAPASKTAPARKTAPRKVASDKLAASVDERSRAKAIREWAAANGHIVSERGRIAASVVEAFNAAQ